MERKGSRNRPKDIRKIDLRGKMREILGGSHRTVESCRGRRTKDKSEVSGNKKFLGRDFGGFWIR